MKSRFTICSLSPINLEEIKKESPEEETAIYIPWNDEEIIQQSMISSFFEVDTFIAEFLTE